MDTQTAQAIAEKAKKSGVLKGHLLLQAEDYREAAEKCNAKANRYLGKGFSHLAEEAFTEEEAYWLLAADFRAAARLM